MDNNMDNNISPSPGSPFAMADHEDFDDDLLDSALDGFRGVDGLGVKPSEAASVSQSGPSQSSTVAKPTSGVQGLGTGLPSLASGKKKSSGKGSKDKNVAGKVADTNRGSNSQASLSATLERLAEQTRHTVESIDAPSVGESTADDMESFVKQFEALGGSQDMQGLMDTMMQQLLSKEVLYEPMKEIGERYPEWLESHKSELSSEDTARYTKQYDFIKQLCHAYETTPGDFKKIVDLMQNMQECGQPPPDIVRELAPGLELGEDGLPMLPDITGVDPLGGPGNCSIM
ncbi:hypothetical protein M758_6G144800 [Ceratodon purpureus]|uniref:Uncharacterized protein n=1 Tax=Ceratodon purpureus TaxID=3225 RepID=A0A8T0HG50_CERPU|nr:hypothetical protein KC19_6G150600 [Ceratodon purpureus]KAG0614014.1 hypothetical protein M758_6G144800 [Ceratodon purpureus]